MIFDRVIQFPKMKRQATGKGMVLYEEVLQKNFEIIQTFLNKFPVIFKKQDYFQQSIKKINDKLLKYDSQTDKIRQELVLTTTVLDKKIVHLKQSTARNSRSSMRGSQDMISMEQRKNSIFRISSGMAKENKEQAAVFSKEKMELLSQMDKKQQESNNKIKQLESTIQQLHDKLNFISVMNGKCDRAIDSLIQEKVDKNQIEKIQTEYERKFQKAISSLAEQKYLLGQKLIDQQISFLETNFRKDLFTELDEVKKSLLGQLQKKAAVSQFRNELKEIKVIIEKMVEQSVDSFASKEQTKMALVLFEKKFAKMQLVMQEFLQRTLKSIEQENIQGILFNHRKDKEGGVMSSFGRKRRAANQK